MWSSTDIRTLAIEHLTDLASPIEKLVLGHAYNVAEWRVPSYVALSLRQEMLSPTEAKKLPVLDVLAIASTREAISYGRVEATPKAVTAHVIQHVSHISPTEGAGDGPPTPNEDQLPESSPLPQAVPVTPEPISEQKRARLSALIAEGNYKEALSNITSQQIPSFCSLLRNSWGALLTEANARNMVRAVLYNAATNPTFTHTGIQFLRGLSAAMRTGAFETESPACRSMEAFLNRDIRALRDTWSTCDDVRLRHRSLHKDWAHWHACVDTFSSAATEIFGGDDVRNSCELYITRSSHLKDFIHALVGAGVVNDEVL